MDNYGVVKISHPPGNKNGPNRRGAKVGGKMGALLENASALELISSEEEIPDKLESSWQEVPFCRQIFFYFPYDTIYFILSLNFTFSTFYFGSSLGSSLEAVV